MYFKLFALKCCNYDMFTMKLMSHYMIVWNMHNLTSKAKIYDDRRVKTYCHSISYVEYKHPHNS
jgi:hypothetical protein